MTDEAKTGVDMLSMAMPDVEVDGDFVQEFAAKKLAHDHVLAHFIQCRRQYGLETSAYMSVLLQVLADFTMQASCPQCLWDQMMATAGLEVVKNTKGECRCGTKH